MAKTAIKRLKERRFWRWIMVEVWRKPAMAEYYRKHPIKQKNLKRWHRLSQRDWREIDKAIERGHERVLKLLDEHRAKTGA